MDWVQVITIILSLAGVTYWFKSELEKDIQRIDTDIKGLAQKLDIETKAQTARTDQLYQMFIDLLKEGRTRTNP